MSYKGSWVTIEPSRSFLLTYKEYGRQFPKNVALLTLQVCGLYFAVSVVHHCIGHMLAVSPLYRSVSSAPLYLLAMSVRLVVRGKLASL